MFKTLFTSFLYSIGLLGFGLGLFALPVNAQQVDQVETRLIEGTVTNIVSTQELTVQDRSQVLQLLEILVTSGNEKGRTIQVEAGGASSVREITYAVGDQVQILAGLDPQGKPVYQISDYVRRGPLLVLGLLFIGVTLLISFKRGALSLLAMVLTFVLIFTIVLPLLLAGWNPIMVSLGAALVMIPVTFYLSHGFNRKTTVAVVGTLTSLLTTAVLAQIFINWAKLGGLTSDEAGMLQMAQSGVLNMQGLLLAGMILGLSGVLDDITISQSAIVQQLKEAQPSITFSELYARAMSVGRDHIASLVNTLILVYTGAAMPLLLLFSQNGRPFSEVINYEVVAEEIVRTLVVSIGIVLSVPLTTFLAAYWEKLDTSKFNIRSKLSGLKSAN